MHKGYAHDHITDLANTLKGDKDKHRRHVQTYLNILTQPLGQKACSTVRSGCMQHSHG